MEQLLSEVKSSAKDPFTIKSFYVLFVTAFALLLIPLSVLAIVSQRSLYSEAKNSCAVPAERTFTGSTDKTRDGEHVFVFDGAGCQLTAWVNWTGKEDLSLWIYEPDGNIHVMDKYSDKNYELLRVSEPVKAGKFRVAVRLVSGDRSNYSATVSFR